ncbi:glycosyltransferase family 2 protein [Marinilactibacillus sp. XAAS-LB27]|uniref:glycosyltransferase family 2 protein n=1 Tax=Marinilactibacillus sp. XAAS-LB27 TaxID=3114538 RepID=UPI002E177419|nr:glycosyltransferase family 2 protein [Marinilactibacillus sp. XAAS-LB27]
MKQPLVSIIIPTYNVERYIEECLDSVLAQTYEALEIIVIDDGSTDATPYLLKQYEQNVTLMLNKENRGQGAVRNQGTEKASGEYLLFVDSDDWIEKNTVETLIFKAQKTGADLVRFNGQSFSEGSEQFEHSVDYDFSSILDEHIIYEGEVLLSKNQKAYSASPCLYMINKEIIDMEQIRFPEGILHEDEYFTTKIFISSKKMVYVNKTFYHRRYRVASTMTESTPLHKKKSFDSYMEVFCLIESDYQSNQYNLIEKTFLKRQLISIYSGLQHSQVEPKMKKQLNNLRTIKLQDKLRIKISILRQKLKK